MLRRKIAILMAILDLFVNSYTILNAKEQNFLINVQWTSEDVKSRSQKEINFSENLEKILKQSQKNKINGFVRRENHGILI